MADPLDDYVERLGNWLDDVEAVVEDVESGRGFPAETLEKLGQEGAALDDLAERAENEAED